jgi:serpin B
MRLRCLPVLLLPLACAACDPAGPPASSASSVSSTPQPSVEAPRSPPGAAAAPPSTDELVGLAKSHNAFALDFYARARAAKGNLALSPLSIATALTMTWAGARGETAAQMQKVLHLEGSPDRALDAAGKLVASYEGAGQKVTLRLANRLFGEKSYTFDAGYLDRIRAAFGAPLEPVDFRGGADVTRQHINAWVAAQTQDRIKDLLPPASVDAAARLVLVNAIYFLGDWAQPFKKEATGPASFSTTAADRKDVPTMHQTADLRFAAADHVKVLELPYQGGDLTMTLVLPDAADGLDAVEARLTPSTLDAWLGALAATKVVVSLPKIEIDPPTPLSLADTLQAMGMPLAFDPARADFTGIANPPSPADRLYVTRVFHKAFVKVDEKGTEAAAATAVVLSPRALRRQEQPPAEFKADHPFLFLLRDVRSGMILFMGRVSDPAARG